MKVKLKLSIVVVVILSITACKSAKYPYLQNGLYADIQTVKGDILLKLYADKLPMTVANFVALAEGTHPKVIASLRGKRFYDGITFHRVIEGFMIQAGDPTGTGEGNVGYKFEDEFPKNASGGLLYKHDREGVLSMANAGKATNSSQFFITRKATPWLDGKHSVFGKVELGQKVVDNIKQRDRIKRVDIIRVGKSAKKFDAPSVFMAKTKKTPLQEKVDAKKLEQEKDAFQKKMGISKAKTTTSGLKILILNKGEGNQVTNATENTIYYTLYTANGKLIQSNVGQKPFTFSVGDDKPLLAGFKEGVLTMKQGEKVRLFVPYYLGFGDKEDGPVPPNSDLIFEVEVVKVTK